MMDKSFKEKLAAFLAANLEEWPQGVVAFGPLTTFNGFVGRPDLSALSAVPGDVDKENWGVATLARESLADINEVLAEKLQELGVKFGCPAGVYRISWLHAALETLKQAGYTYHGGELWKPPVGQPPAYITWNGEGLPPVGAVTEYRLKPHQDWYYAAILYISDNHVVFYDDKGYEHAESHVSEFEFRPLLTPEEKAAKVKQQAICFMADVFSRHGHPGDVPDKLSYIYDAMIQGDIPGVNQK